MGSEPWAGSGRAPGEPREPREPHEPHEPPGQPGEPGEPREAAGSGEFRQALADGENPPVTEPPVTEPPVAHPPVTEPPVAHPPVAHPPVAHPPAGKWRKRLRRLLTRPMDKEAALGMIAGMGLLIFVDPVLVFGRDAVPVDKPEIVLPRQRAASD